MNISLGLISFIGMWAAQICYVLVYIPQIITNFKQKSGKGLSELMIFAYFNTMVAVLYYVFASNLPMAYKICCPLQIFALIVLIGQRLYYDDFKQAKPFWFLYSGNMMASLFFIPLTIQDPIGVGCFAGWTMFAFSLVNQLPQVVKIFKHKSVVGFSFFFAGFSFMAALVELATAWFVGLPIQTLLSALRGIVIGAIWFGQFWLYSE